MELWRGRYNFFSISRFAVGMKIFFFLFQGGLMSISRWEHFFYLLSLSISNYINYINVILKMFILVKVWGNQCYFSIARSHSLSTCYGTLIYFHGTLFNQWHFTRTPKSLPQRYLPSQSARVIYPHCTLWSIPGERLMNLIRFLLDLAFSLSTSLNSRPAFKNTDWSFNLGLLTLQKSALFYLLQVPGKDVKQDYQVPGKNSNKLYL